MNRIALCDAPLPQPNFHPSRESADEQCSRAETPDHSVFVPLHYESRYSYPAVVWLHGPADDRGQLKKIMPHVSMRNYVGISPCGTELIAGAPTCDGYLGYTWRQELEQISEAQERVLACVQLIQDRFNICSSRIFLAGYDSGGTMALRLGMLHPELFAGVASICGGLPQGLMPFMHINRARRLPMFLTYGRDSQDYSMTDVCQDLRLLHAGGIRVSIRQFPCEHEVTTPMLNDLNRWMMEIITGQPQATESQNSVSNHHLN